MRATIVIAVLGWMIGAAHAQTGAEAKAAADAAYKKGKALQDAGDCGAAIPQFAKSQELDPQLGTQYNLALCLQDVGRIASAWVEFNELAAKDTNKKRKADAAKRAKALEPKLTRMAITVGAPVEGLVVKKDGVDVTALIDVETPVDPTISDFEASAPGYGSWHAEVDFTVPGETVAIDVPELAKVAGPDLGDGEPDGDGEVIDDGSMQIDEPPPPPGDPGKGRRIAGMSMAGVGVIATGLGVLFGVQAMGLTGDAETACGGALDSCSGDVDAAQALIDDARGKANLSNLFVGAGVAVAVVGVVLWVTAPSADAPERSALVPTVSADGFGLAYDGAW